MADPYVQVLRTPHALPMVTAAFIGRLPVSMVGLGRVLPWATPLRQRLSWVLVLLTLCNIPLLVVATVAAALDAVVVAPWQRLPHVPAEHASEPAFAG